MKTIVGSIVARLARTKALRVLIFVGACSGASAQVLDVSNLPLYGGLQPHPNVALTLSVEFPTVSQAYRGIAYARTTVYAGYFDPTQCYQYNGNSSTGLFVVKSTADSNHECGGNNDFSGNMMNWATMSAIDEFRYAMTGGNRIDESGPSNGTTIERAYLPDGKVAGVPGGSADNVGYYAGNGGYFPVLTLNSSFSSPLARVVPNSIAGSGTVYITSCGSKVFFSSSFPGGNCANPSVDATYHVAVNVCDNNEGPIRTDLCLPYTGGKYKPVGQMQINAARMRFAAFGFLMDRKIGAYSLPSGCDEGTGWNRCRYGGVLRAPMKYLGPKTYDAAQTATTNPKAEINADGSLVADPDGTASTAGGTNSGAINYVNKFGSGTNALNPGVGGVYKRLDPGGEMFYEAVRYYQNLGPTDLATSLMPALATDANAVKDYFPITTNWTDPIGSVCSNNFIINLSDANMWDDQYVPGFKGTPGVQGIVRPASRAVGADGLDAVEWTRKIGVLESTTASIAAGSSDVDPGLSGLETRYASAGQGQHGTYFAAGISYWANVNDIRSDLTGKQTIKTISFDVNEPGSIAFQDRPLFLMGKYGGFTNTIDRVPADTIANPFYGANPANPQGAAIRTNSEWADSTGAPTNYLIASDPQRLINGVRAAFATINTPTGTLSGAALTSANLTFGAAGAFVATFNPSKWSGSVLLNSLSVDTSGDLVVSPTPVWDSGALLTARCGTVASGSTVCSDSNLNAATMRTIFTTIKVAGVRTAAPFTLLGITPDTSYLAALSINPATSTPDLNVGARINYLRGFRGDEASLLNFRVRDSAMGDIVNSGPVYVGPPAAGVPDADFQSFYLANANRTAAVYAGANDGMLHAIRASDGSELFSYIPGYSYPDLNDLTNPGYLHQSYVDAVPKVQDVKLNGTWKSVLVGASGNGVQGIFGLDVTDPTSFGGSKVLFEFSDADDVEFGSVLSPVEIAKLWVSGTAAAPVYRYFAVVTGYNKNRTSVNNRTDGNVGSSDQKGVLFLIALDHTLGTNWVLNTDYYKFTFPASNAAVANGLGPVTLSLSKSGDLSTVAMYFGDLQGNLWKLNTATGVPSTWATALGTSTTPLPLFVAQDGSGNRQPITARPELAGGPFGSTLVFFGTGKFVGQTDVTLPAPVQSEYSLLDVNPSVAITRSTDLVQRTATVSGTNVTVAGSAFTYSGPSGKKGWYLDFPSSVSLGERSVTKPAIRTGLLTFTTLTLSNDVCTPGNGYIYQVNALTGLPLTGGSGGVGGYASTVGIPGPPRVVDLTTTAGVTQATGEVINKKTQVTLVSGTAGKIGGYGGKDPTTNKNLQVPNPPTQQINWREITNWNDKTGH